MTKKRQLTDAEIISLVDRERIAAALTALPQRDLVEVLNYVFSRRGGDVAAASVEEAKLVLAEVYRARNDDGSYSASEVLVLASPLDAGAFATDVAPTQEGKCCGVTLAGYARTVICPLCSQQAYLT